VKREDVVEGRLQDWVAHQRHSMVSEGVGTVSGHSAADIASLDSLSFWA